MLLINEIIRRYAVLVESYKPLKVFTGKIDYKISIRVVIS